MVLSPPFNPSVVTHNMNYYRSLMVIDAASPPAMSAGSIMACQNAVDDVANQVKE